MLLARLAAGLTGEPPMTAASRSLATALWRARFASGLLRPRYPAKGAVPGGLSRPEGAPIVVKGPLPDDRRIHQFTRSLHRLSLTGKEFAADVSETTA